LPLEKYALPILVLRVAEPKGEYGVGKRIGAAPARSDTHDDRAVPTALHGTSV
jgi:hypothetical protein